MRIHIAGAIATAILLSPPAAFAADPVADIASVYGWTGFHIGIFGGVAGGETNYPFDVKVGGNTVADGEFELDASGLFGGLSAGYDFQAGNLVLGVVGDIAATNYEGNLDADILIPGLNVDLNAELGSELEWFATIRGRAGIAWDNLLIYGTGGVAFAEIESSYDISGTLPIVGAVDESGSEKTDHVGFAVGAGLEYAITESVSLTTEYLYVDLGEEEIASAFLRGSSASISIDPEFHTLKAGLNYRF